MPVATRSPEAEAVAAIDTGQVLGWDGQEVEAWDQDYEDYLNSRPPREKLRPYKEPVHYWEVEAPGCTIQPYPRMGSMRSTYTGMWTALNAAQEEAIRHHLAVATRRDPDTLKVTPEQAAIFSGKAPGDLRFCHSPACHFITSSLFAANLHETLRGHTTHAQPRKD